MIRLKSEASVFNLFQIRSIRVNVFFVRLPLREPVNGLTHLVGAVLSVIGLVVLVVIAIENHSPRQIVGFSIFGASLVSMYCASAFYHSLKVSERGVAHLRRIDHMMIYILIAGSYTPICLVLLRGRLGIWLLVAVWALAALGVFQTVIWMHAPVWLSTVLYIGMGWIAVFIVRPLLASIFFFFFFFCWCFFSVLRAALPGPWVRPRPAPPLFYFLSFFAVWVLWVGGGVFSALCLFFLQWPSLGWFLFFFFFCLLFLFFFPSPFFFFFKVVVF